MWSLVTFQTPLASTIIFDCSSLWLPRIRTRLLWWGIPLILRLSLLPTREAESTTCMCFPACLWVGKGPWLRRWQSDIQAPDCDPGTTGLKKHLGVIAGSGAVEAVIPEGKGRRYRPAGTAWCMVVAVVQPQQRGSAWVLHCDWGPCAKLWSLWGCFSAQRFSELLNSLILFQLKSI